MERFIIEKHPEKALFWICTDQENGVACEFEHGKFFGKKVFISFAGKPHPNYFEMEELKKEIEDWLIKTIVIKHSKLQFITALITL